MRKSGDSSVNEGPVHAEDGLGTDAPDAGVHPLRTGHGQQSRTVRQAFLVPILACELILILSKIVDSEHKLGTNSLLGFLIVLRRRWDQLEGGVGRQVPCPGEKELGEEQGGRRPIVVQAVKVVDGLMEV